MSSNFIFGVPPLDASDQSLVEAYSAVGHPPVDTLPYTDEFDRICEILALPDSKDARRQVYRRLVRLRKQGRLPNVWSHAT
ncbi:MAG TPA: hypothetical protein VGH33_01865 [Isosphaeraceae bacterium]